MVSLQVCFASKGVFGGEDGWNGSQISGAVGYHWVSVIVKYQVSLGIGFRLVPGIVRYQLSLGTVLLMLHHIEYF